MEVAVFTGAGASRPLNYPTTIEFFHEKDLPDPHREIFQKLKSFLGTNILDVEDALRLLDPVVEFLDSPSGKFVTSNVGVNLWPQIKNFVTYVRRRCFDLYGVEPPEDAVLSLYQPLLNALNPGENCVHLFTTNYDPVTDCLMKIARKQGWYTYDGFDPMSEWSSDGYENDAGLMIYRLHGSLSWGRRNSDIVNLRIFNRLEGFEKKHLLIYPGFKGNPEENGEDAFAYPHKRLREVLGSVPVCIVIGFSFRDPHINGIFKSTLESNNALKLITVLPSIPESVDSAITEIVHVAGERFIHIAGKFGDESVIDEIRSGLQ